MLLSPSYDSRRCSFYLQLSTKVQWPGWAPRPVAAPTCLLGIFVVGATDLQHARVGHCLSRPLVFQLFGGDGLPAGWLQYFYTRYVEIQTLLRC